MSAVSPGAMSRLSSGSGDNKPSTATTTTTTRCVGSCNVLKLVFRVSSRQTRAGGHGLESSGDHSPHVTKVTTHDSRLQAVDACNMTPHCAT